MHYHYAIPPDQFFFSHKEKLEMQRCATIVHHDSIALTKASCIIHNFWNCYTIFQSILTFEVNLQLLQTKASSLSHFYFTLWKVFFSKTTMRKLFRYWVTLLVLTVTNKLAPENTVYLSKYWNLISRQRNALGW